MAGGPPGSTITQLHSFRAPEPAAYRTPHLCQGDLMAIQYKVVELKGQSDPRSSGETPEVTAEAIETALNQQGRDNQTLYHPGTFYRNSHTEATIPESAHPHSGTPRHRCDPHLQEDHGVICSASSKCHIPSDLAVDNCPQVLRATQPRVCLTQIGATSVSTLRRKAATPIFS